MLLFSVLVLFCIVSAFVTYGLGIFVLAQNPASKINRLFFGVMLAAAYWSLGEFLIWFSGNFEGTWFWLKASAFWPLVVALMAHFILIFTENPLIKKREFPIVLAIIYAPGIIFGLIEIISGSIYTVGYQAVTGFVYLPVQNSLVYLAETAYILIVILGAGFASFAAWRNAKNRKIKRQNRLVTLGLVIVIGYGFLSGILLPSTGVYLPNLVFIGIVIFSLLITYAILRYGLFSLTPETAAQDILRAMPDGLIITDMDCNILTSNTSASLIFKTTIEDLRGRNLESIIPDQGCMVIKSIISERETFSDLEVRLEQDNKVVSIASALIKDPEGEQAGLVLIIRDISGRKESEKALRLAKEKISLLTRLSRHDINNFLTILWGYLELIKDLAKDPVCDSYISKSINEVEKIRGYLQFTRDYEDIGSYQPAWQNLDSIVGRALEDLAIEGIEIVTRLEPVEIFVDPLAVKVIYNLFENAIRHGQHLTRIEIVTVEQPGGDLLLSIEDNGIGIPKCDKEKIFNYGFGKNTGIGLGISRDILSLTRITIKETGIYGKGARFEITIPKGAWRIYRAT